MTNTNLYYAEDEIINVTIYSSGPFGTGPINSSFGDENNVILVPNNSKTNTYETGAGKDTIVIQRADFPAYNQVTVIKDFDLNNDIIDLSYYSIKDLSYKDLSYNYPGLSFEKLKFSTYENSTLITLPEKESIVLIDIDKSQITPDIFKFKQLEEDKFSFILGGEDERFLEGDAKDNYIYPQEWTNMTIMLGGRGSDHFVFDDLFYNTRFVSDFNVEEDKIYFTTNLNGSKYKYSDIKIADYKGTAVLSIGGDKGNFILECVDRYSLTEDNFEGVEGNFSDIKWVNNDSYWGYFN